MSGQGYRSEEVLSMLRPFALFVIGTLLFAFPATHVQTLSFQPPPAVDADWPLFRGDPLQTGVAKGALPDKLEIRWKVDLKKGIESTAAIVKDTVYVVGQSGLVVSIDYTAWGWIHLITGAILIAAGLGVPFASVRVIHSDTAEVERGQGTWGSRSLQAGGSVIVARTGASASRPFPSSDHEGVGRPAWASFSFVPIFESVFSQALVLHPVQFRPSAASRAGTMGASLPSPAKSWPSWMTIRR